MKRSNCSRSLLFAGLILAISGIFSFPKCWAASEDRKTILSSDLSDNASLPILNKYLSAGDTLDCFTVRQKLLTLPFEELKKLRTSCGQVDGLREINRLLDSIISELRNKGIYLLYEEIYVNNKPAVVDPLQKISGTGINIENLNPSAEYVYLDNLKLNYSKGWLAENSEEWWSDPDGIRECPVETGSEEKFSTQINRKGDSWSYLIPDDLLGDFFYDAREWIKHYEEDLIFPAVYAGMLITRNEYRIFGVNRENGKKIWSFSPDSIGREHYQTLRHPHVNQYGYEMLVSEGVVYSELDNKLVAVKIKNALTPEPIWSKGLGEYTVCTAPVLNNGILVAGLINSRGEFWLCGFNPATGGLSWSSYIGTTSFLSPVSVLSQTKGNRVFIGSNLGALVCLDSRNGRILWLRKYAPKKYSMFDYVKNGHYKDKISGRGSLPYDTQFLLLGENRLLYYKPRESDHLYILNREDGSLTEDILIDPNISYLLGVINAKAILLDKQPDKDKKSELKVIDINSGKEDYSILIPGGAMKGIVYPGNNELLFASGQILTRLTLKGKEILVSQTKLTTPGWLAGCDGNSIFITKDRELYCVGPQNENLPADLKTPVDPVETEYFREAKQKTSPGEMAAPVKLGFKGTHAMLVPVKTTDGVKTDFILLLRNNQMICVDEGGDIIWERKITYNPPWYGQIRPDKKSHTYGEKNVEAYLHNSTLIINDLVNIIGINASDGRYTWSITNNSDDLRNKKQDNLFVDKIRFRMKSLGGRLIVTHGNRIYSINPETGHRYAECELPAAGVVELAVSGNQAYALSFSPDRIDIFNRDLEREKEIPLGSLSRNTIRWPQIYFMGKFLLLKSGADLFIIDTEKEELKYKFGLSGPETCIDTYNDTLLTITPFKQIAAYRVGENSLDPIWKSDLPHQNRDFSMLGSLPYDKYYFMTNNLILLPYKENGGLKIAAFHSDTGKAQWRSSLDKIKGKQKNISNFVNLGKEIYFIISSGCGGIAEGQLNECCNSPAIDTEHLLVNLGLTDGKINLIRKLPSLMKSPLLQNSSNITETKHCLVYEVDGNIEAEGKK